MQNPGCPRHNFAFFACNFVVLSHIAKKVVVLENDIPLVV